MGGVRQPGDILLVACYELGHQPLAVALPAAFLERAGYRPATLDIAVERFDPERARRARLVAISVPMHTALRLGVSVAARVRDVNPAAHVCFFGLYAALNAEYLLAHGADTVLAGECEERLVELARALERGAGPAHGVLGGEAGGTTAAGGRSGAGAPAPGRPPGAVLAKLRFPVPIRAGLPPLRKYAHLERDGRRHPAGRVEASRGCKHRCAHCPIPPVYDGRFFVVPAEVVLADVRQLVAAGARHITFGDPDFLNGPRHALGVARALHAEFPDLSFDITTKVEHLVRHRALLPELAALGCLFVVSAVESLSDTVLRHLAKGHTRRDVLAALRAVRAAGLVLRPTWVPFTPWTTLDDYQEMLAFAEAEDLVDHVDPVQWGIRLLVPPRSLLAQSPALRPHLGPLVERDFSYQWVHPDPRMDRLQADVARLVAEAAERGEEARVTFRRVQALADAAAGAPVARARLAPTDPDRRPPRLTEPWFC
jgi:radical SAM superfamily enzyme YgiQ (UPF0313 family)